MRTADERAAGGVVDVGDALVRRRWRARWRRWRALVVGLVAAIAVAVLAWLVWFSAVLTVEDVEVTGNATVTSARIEKAAKVSVGTQLVRVDLDAIRARVESLAPIAAAQVSRSWPHAIRIEVTERVPVAVVRRGDADRLRAVDDAGVLFGSYQKAPAGLPVIHTATDVTVEALAEAAEVVTSLRADIAAEVEYVDVESVDRIRLRLTGDREVMWGSAEQSAQKAEVLSALLGQKKVTEIDVSVPGRPTTR